MPQEQMTTIEARLPTQLLLEANVPVQKGWFGSIDEVVVEALAVSSNLAGLR